MILKRLISLIIPFLFGGCQPTYHYNLKTKNISLLDLLSEPAVVKVDKPTKSDAHKVTRIYLNGEVNKDRIDSVIKAMETAVTDKNESILLELNTRGGDSDAGRDLVREIDNLGIPVHCVVDGNALSMGAFILENCKTRIITERSVIMFHQAWIDVQYGNETSLKGSLSELQAIDNALFKPAARRMGMTLEAFKLKIMVSEWWMDSSEAVKANAADYEVLSDKDVIDSLRKTGKPWPESCPIRKDSTTIVITNSSEENICK